MNIKETVEMTVNTVNAFVIGNSEDLQNATNFIKEIKEKSKFVKEHYEPMLKATKEAYDKVKFERDYYLKPLETAETNMKSLMNEYNNKILALQRAEAEAKRKAEEEQRKKLEEMQKAVAEGDIAKVQENIEEVLATTTTEETVEKPQIQGMNTRTVYEIEVTDITKVPATLNRVLLVELSKIGKTYLLDQYKLMKALKKDFKVDGIEVIEKVTTVIR